MTVAGADELMAVVKASPAAVAAHDKQAWLDLWATNHVIEDPVGSRPVLGGTYDRRSGGRTNGPLSRFWDTFIAANEITFTVHHDFVGDGRVVRDVTIATTLPSGVQASTPAHLLYELVDEYSSLKIRRMAAHWEVAPVFAQLIRPTPAHLRAMASSNARMVRHLGVGGSVRFVAAIRSVGADGKRAVTELCARAAAGDAAALGRLGGAAPREFTKVIASGDVVTVSCTVRDAPAVLIAAVNRRTKTVAAVDVFTDQYRASAPARAGTAR